MEWTFGANVCEDKTELLVEGSKATEVMDSNIVGGVKRKRSHFSEEEVLMITNMTDVSTMWLMPLERYAQLI